MTATHRLQRLFDPRSIAVVGASPKGGYGRQTLRNLDLLGYDGDVAAVHRTADRIDGTPAYRSLRDLPFVPDAVVLAVPAKEVGPVAAEAAALGVGGLVVFASGFRESGGDGSRREADLVEAVGDRLPVLGPNCLGLVNYRSHAAMWGTELPRHHQRGGGGVALVAQSGAMLITTLLSGRLPDVTYAASIGNQAVVDVNDCLELFLTDPEVKTIGLVAEGIADLGRFRHLASQAHARAVSLVVLKLGRSARAQAASVAHTGTLAGDAAAYDAAFEQAGAHRVDDLDELIAACRLLTHEPAPRAGRLAAFATSGGECGLVADLADEVGVELAELDAATEARLGELVPPYGRVGNPLDLTAGAWADAEVYEGVTRALGSCPGVGLVTMIGDAPTHLGPLEGSGWEEMLAGAGRAARATGVPVAVVTTTTDVLPGFGPLAERSGVLLLAGARPAMRAIAAAQAAGARRVLAVATDVPPAADLVRCARGVLAGRGGVLGESESKDLVGLFGVASPDGGRHHDVEQLLRIADRIGYPVVAKVDGVAHKSDRGGVKTGIGGPAALRTACAEIWRATRGLVAGTPMIRVERMVGDAVELIVGGRNSEAGSLVVVGAGGVLTEILQDVRTLLWPFTEDDAHQALTCLRIGRLLAGYRGSPPVDVGAVAQVMVGTGRLLAALPEVREVDLNPVLANADGCVAADALVVVDNPPKDR